MPTTGGEHAGQHRPNVLFLLSDQHNPHIVGFAGNRIIRTQNLDRLAAESAQFDAAYCQFPLCTPSRISMWTGLLPHRCSAWSNNYPILPGLTTIPGHFGDHGYATCGVGKMHEGGERPMNGFQVRPYGDLRPNPYSCHQPDPLHTIKNHIWTNHKIGHFPFAGPSEIPNSLLQDNVVTRESLAFILDHQQQHPDQPWFLCASYQRPHHPLTAPACYFRHYWPDGPALSPLPTGYPDSIHPHDRFIVDDYHLAEFSREDLRRGLAAYYASVDFMDDCAGDLLSGLEREGLLDNTIIIYTSDHGDLESEHGLWWKRSYYDGSARVPVLLRVPGGNPQRVSAPVELLDLFPTLCELCDLPVPEGLDGESLLPLIRADASSPHRKDFARSEHIARMETTFRMIRTSQWKYVEFPEYPPVLFDMKHDPDEEHNLAASPECAAVVAELHQRLWEDGQSWESLNQQREADRERLEGERHVCEDCSPNQYCLANGEIVNADAMLYERILKETP